MPLPVFPAHVFNPQGIKAGVDISSISGGRSLSDIEDVILTDGGGKWGVTYSGINLRSVANIRLWEQWTSYMPGRAFLVPLVSLITAPRPVAGLGLARPPSLETDNDAFPTVVRYASPYIVAQTVGDSILRATTLTITVSQGARIQGGEKCSIGGQGFKIERVVSRSGQQATVVVSPPARSTIASGSDVNFEWPVVKCRLVPGQDLTPELRFGRYAEMSISFVEDFSDAD